MTKILTNAQRTQIILNDQKGIIDPDYYVDHYRTGKKAGQPFVRQRAQRLEELKPRSGVRLEQSSRLPTQRAERLEPEAVKPVHSSSPEAVKPVHSPSPAAVESGERLEDPKPQIDYNFISTKQTAEKLVQLLEDRAVSRDGNLNAVENERETAQNREFAAKTRQEPPIAPVRRSRIRPAF